jgi:glucokinase
VVGIDIGGTKVACSALDQSGELVARSRRPTDPSGDPERDLARMADDLKALVAESPLEWHEIAAVGVSVPGPFDPERGLVLQPPNLPGWDEVAVGPLLETALGRPVRLENDANAAALAEWHFGAGRGSQHMVYLTMSTGVGAGLVLGGRIHRGLNASAGEVGHAPIEWEGEPCACGLRGCLEAYVGGAAWSRRLRDRVPDASRVLLLAGARDRVTPEHVVGAAREGDRFALEELERFNHYLARGIVSLAFTVAPERVVLGTIAVAAGEALCLEPVRRMVRAATWDVVNRGLEIVPAALGAELPYWAGVCAALG